MSTRPEPCRYLSDIEAGIVSDLHDEGRLGLVALSIMIMPLVGFAFYLAVGGFPVVLDPLWRVVSAALGLALVGIFFAMGRSQVAFRRVRVGDPVYLVAGCYDFRVSADSPTGEYHTEHHIDGYSICFLHESDRRRVKYREECIAEILDTRPILVVRVREAGGKSSHGSQAVKPVRIPPPWDRWT